MRIAGGYATLSGPEGMKEWDTFTCIHCNTVVHVQPKQEVGWCNMCFKPICPACNRVGTCIPFEKKLDEYERRQRLICEMV